MANPRLKLPSNLKVALSPRSLLRFRGLGDSRERLLKGLAAGILVLGMVKILGDFVMKGPCQQFNSLMALQDGHPDWDHGYTGYA